MKSSLWHNDRHKHNHKQSPSISQKQNKNRNKVKFALFFLRKSQRRSHALFSLLMLMSLVWTRLSAFSRSPNFPLASITHEPFLNYTMSQVQFRDIRTRLVRYSNKCSLGVAPPYGNPCFGDWNWSFHVLIAYGYF